MKAQSRQTDHRADIYASNDIFELSSSTNKSRLLEEAARPFIFPSDSAALTNPTEERKKEEKGGGGGRKGRNRGEETRDQKGISPRRLFKRNSGRENTPMANANFRRLEDKTRAILSFVAQRDT